MTRPIAKLCCISVMSIAALALDSRVDREPVSGDSNITRVPPLQATEMVDDNHSHAFQEPERKSISPYSIKEYIEQHSSDRYVKLDGFWKPLGIDVEEWEQYGRCEATIFELGFGTDQPMVVMLRLYDHSGWSMGGTRYVFFKKANDSLLEWVLLGYTDFQDQRYQQPEHRVIESGTGRWIVFKILAGRGSGYSRYNDEWYEIGDNGIKDVLIYVSGEYLGSFDPTPTVSLGSKIVSATTESDQTTVVVEFSASYYKQDTGPSIERIDLWTKTKRAVFVRSPGAEKFLLNEAQSQLSSAELEVFCDNDGISNSEFLQRNFHELEKIAGSTDEARKTWLRSFLQQCTHTTTSERLLRILESGS